MPVCRACSFPMESGKSQCTSCGHWTLVAPRQEQELFTLADEDDEEIAKICPDTWWGELLSGGLPNSASILMGGDPGAGKSTILLQMALACIKATKKGVLYLAVEERGQEIRPRAKRVGFKHRHLERVVLLRPDNLEGDENLECLEQFSHDEICFAVVDSLSALSGRNEEESARLCQLVHGWCKDTNIPCVLVDHVTKSNDFAGLRALEHFVDITVYLSTHKGQPRRTWTTEKNRFGIGQMVGEVCMTEAGIVVPMVLDEKTGNYVSRS